MTLKNHLYANGGRCPLPVKATSSAQGSASWIPQEPENPNYNLYGHECSKPM